MLSMLLGYPKHLVPGVIKWVYQVLCRDLGYSEMGTCQQLVYLIRIIILGYSREETHKWQRNHLRKRSPW